MALVCGGVTTSFPWLQPAARGRAGSEAAVALGGGGGQQRGVSRIGGRSAEAETDGGVGEEDGASSLVDCVSCTSGRTIT